MRDGWSLKDAARVLEIHERRVTQALDPALDKIARLWQADATRTVEAILAAVKALPMDNREIDLRESIADGVADRARLFRRPTELS